MSRAIDELTREHQVIEGVLGSLERFAAGPGTAAEDARETLGRYVRFFREFADRCHHGKEEDRLLPRMVRHGLPADEGPRLKVLDEHATGRAHVRELAALAEGRGSLSPAEVERLRATVRGYAELLHDHIAKEDQLLFPLAEKTIPAGELEELADDFARFERDVMGPRGHEELHTLAMALLAAHPAPAAA